MKKISTIFLSLLIIVLITGCGKVEDKEEKLVCIITQNDDGMVVEQINSMTYKNDKLIHMTLEVNNKITDSVIKENWNFFKTSMNKENKEFDKDGISLKVDINDQSYEYKTILDIDVLNASKEALEEQGFGDLKDNSGTLAISKEVAEKDGAICEVK